MAWNQSHDGRLWTECKQLLMFWSRVGENKGERGGWGDKEGTKNKEEKLKEIKTRTETLTKEIDKYERKQIKRKKLIQRLRVKERKIQSW